MFLCEFLQTCFPRTGIKHVSMVAVGAGAIAAAAAAAAVAGSAAAAAAAAAGFVAAAAAANLFYGFHNFLLSFIVFY